MWIFYLAFFSAQNLLICAYPVPTDNEGLEPAKMKGVKDVDSAHIQDEQLLNTAFITALMQMPRVIKHLEDRILRMISTYESSAPGPQSAAGGESNMNETCSQGNCDEDSIVAKVLERLSADFVRKEDLQSILGEQEKKINFNREEAIQTAMQDILMKINPVLSALEKAVGAVQTSLDQRPINKVSIADTRNENSLPDAYRAKGPGVYYEFKKKEGIVLSKDFGYSNTAIPGFAVLQTIVPWSDTTGGYVIQIATAGNAMSIRTEEPGNADQWSSWKML